MKIKKLLGENTTDTTKEFEMIVKIDNELLKVGTKYEIDSNTYNRIKDIKSILKNIRSFEKKIKYIDLSWDESKFIKLGKEDDSISEDENEEN